MENMVSDYDIMGKYVLGQSYYDVALLKLLEPLDFNSHVKAICLPTKAFEDKDFYSDRSAYIGGWGKLANGSYSNVLHTEMIQLFPYKMCNIWHNVSHGMFGKVRKKAIPDLFQSNIMCGGRVYSEIDSCHGDSGGPLMWYNSKNEEFMQVLKL